MTTADLVTTAGAAWASGLLLGLAIALWWRAALRRSYQRHLHATRVEYEGMLQTLRTHVPYASSDRAAADSDAFYLRGKSDRQEWRDGYVYIPADWPAKQ